MIFTRINGIGPQGNRAMDSDRLVGFQIFATAAPPGKDGVSEPTQGAIELDELVCVEDDVDPCAVDTRKDPAARAAAARVEGIQFDTDAAYRAVEFGHQICPELCAADPACLYFQVETTFRPRRTPTRRWTSTSGAPA